MVFSYKKINLIYIYATLIQQYYLDLFNLAMSTFGEQGSAYLNVLNSLRNTLAKNRRSFNDCACCQVAAKKQRAQNFCCVVTTVKLVQHSLRKQPEVKIFWYFRIENCIIGQYSFLQPFLQKFQNLNTKSREISGENLILNLLQFYLS